MLYYKKPVANILFPNLPRETGNIDEEKHITEVNSENLNQWQVNDKNNKTLKDQNLRSGNKK
jgi:hypothetical protein